MPVERELGLRHGTVGDEAARHHSLLNRGYVACIDGQDSLVHLQMENFCSLLL
jgi:hypothetical protein